jgi:lipoyl(octanoyl) transferase
MMSIVARDLGTIGFEEAYRLQQDLVEAKIRGRQTDYFLLAEHPHVYTTGRGGDPRNLPCSSTASLSQPPVFRINRGGDATYHGPGQIVGYPLIELKRYGLDVNTYLRRLEQILIETLADFGVPAHTRPGLTGAWTSKGKIGCIGIGVRKGISMHGFSLNADPDLDYFKQINPCGLGNIKITSLQMELGGKVSMAEVKRKLNLHLRSILIGSKWRHRAASDMSEPVVSLKNMA